MRAEAPLLRVRLLGFPLDVQRMSRAWHDELLREFALVALSSADGDDVPKHLIQLVDRTRARYAEFTHDVEIAQQQMQSTGASRGDFDYQVPLALAEACAALDAALDQSEAFCEAGHLLTMRPPAVVTAFRRWVLGEFVHQLRDGAAPVPWSITAEGDVAAASDRQPRP